MALAALVLMYSLGLALGRALWNTLTLGLQMPCTDVTMLQLIHVPTQSPCFTCTVVLKHITYLLLPIAISPWSHILPIAMFPWSHDPTCLILLLSIAMFPWSHVLDPTTPYCYVPMIPRAWSYYSLLLCSHDPICLILQLSIATVCPHLSMYM